MKMLHVRSAGETFGNAVAEFSHLGVPVVTTFSGACAHRTILGERAVVVTDEEELTTAVLGASLGARVGAEGPLPSLSLSQGTSLPSPPPPLSLSPPLDSPFAAFSGLRVGRRFLELVHLAQSVAAVTSGTNGATAGGASGVASAAPLSLTITRPVSGRLLVAGVDLVHSNSSVTAVTAGAGAATLARVSVRLEAAEHAKHGPGLVGLPPPESWRLCISASASFAHGEGRTGGTAGEGGGSVSACSAVLSGGASGGAGGVPLLDLAPLLAHLGAAHAPPRLAPLAITARVIAGAASCIIAETGAEKRVEEVELVAATVVVLCPLPA